MERIDINNLFEKSLDIQVKQAAIKATLDNLYELRTEKIEMTEAIDKRLALLEQTMLLFKSLSEKEALKAKELFTNLINYGLRTVFAGEDIQFDLELKDYKTGVFYTPVIIKAGQQEDVFNQGGGLLDVLSTLCRVIILVCFYKPEQRVLRLDEPAKCLSVEYQQAYVDLLDSLSQQFNIQIIMVTHHLQGCLSKLEDVTVYEATKTEAEGTKFRPVNGAERKSITA